MTIRPLRISPRHCAAALGLLLASAAGAAAEVYQAPDAEPTPAETLILELMNRFRADPAAEADFIVAHYGKPNGIFGSADTAMFLKEVKALKPMPPVVMNLALLDAARKHSFYMIQNGLGHVEEPGKPGFSGASPWDRMKLAGYQGGGGGENAFVGAQGPLDSHVRFIVDDGAGPGGMQPGRGHRANMIGSFREVGPGAVPNGRGLSVTHDLSSRGAARLVGGVVYIDLDDDKFYSMGEGKDGVLITASDGSHATTWSSGGYALELKSAGPISLKAEYHGQQFTKTFPAAADNIGFSWVIAPQVETELCDKLLAALAKDADAASPAHTKAAIALAVAAPGLLVDAAHRDQVKAALGDTGDQLAAAQADVRSGFAGDAVAMRKLLADHGRTYRGTAAAAWFAEAEVAFNASQSVQGFLKQAVAVKPAPSAARDLIKQLEGAREALRFGEFSGRLAGLVARVRSGA
ncbi:MAG: CAP domain-containing protein [Planctomycetes bacterium]|nr:CAP domain-containing protein [Planctomycetota bacterium]